jgi:HEAT repeat protein
MRMTAAMTLQSPDDSEATTVVAPYLRSDTGFRAWLARLLRWRRGRPVILPDRTAVTANIAMHVSLRARLEMQSNVRRRAELALAEAREERDELLKIVDLVKLSWAHVPARINVPEYVARVRAYRVLAATRRKTLQRRLTPALPDEPHLT